MKKLNVFITALLVITSATFTSCKKDDATNFPIINTFTADPSTASEGDTITVSIKVSPGDKDIKYITIRSSVTGSAAYDVASNKEWTGDKDALGYYNKSGIYTATAKFAFPGNTSSVTYTCTAWDTDGNASTAATVTITTGNTDPVFKNVSTEHSSIAVGCLLNDGTGNQSCLASTNGNTYTVSDVKTNANASAIDFVYWWNSGLKATMYSPATIKGAASSLACASIINSWSAWNATFFIKANDLDYDTATLSEVTAKAASATSGTVSELQAGDVVAFKTHDNKIGLFKVNSVNLDSNTPQTYYGTGANINISFLVK